MTTSMMQINSKCLPNAMQHVEAPNTYFLHNLEDRKHVHGASSTIVCQSVATKGLQCSPPRSKPSQIFPELFLHFQDSLFNLQLATIANRPYARQSLRHTVVQRQH